MKVYDPTAYSLDPAGAGSHGAGGHRTINHRSVDNPDLEKWACLQRKSQTMKRDSECRASQDTRKVAGTVYNEQKMTREARESGRSGGQYALYNGSYT